MERKDGRCGIKLEKNENIKIYIMPIIYQALIIPFKDVIVFNP